MRAYWNRLEDTLDRVSSDAVAPIRNMIERMREDVGKPVPELLEPLAAGNANPLNKAVKELAAKPAQDAEELIGVICGKPPAMIREEDCGYVKGLLEAAEQLRPKNDEWKLLLPGRTVSLPPVNEEQGSRETLEKALTQLQQELGLPVDNIARLILEFLFSERAETETRADQDKPT